MKGGRTVLVLVAVALTSVLAEEIVYPCKGHKTFELTMDFDWSAATHPKAFPKGGFFGPVVAASHSPSYTVWSPGSFASRGVQQVAETGHTEKLVRELGLQFGREIFSYENQAWPTSSGTETVQVRLNVRDNRTMISAISQLARSPDWFTGIHSIDTCDADNFAWIEEQGGDLYVYDAGSNRATDFDVDDRPNLRLLQISSIQESQFNGVRVGTWTIKRVPT